mgnify:CR=1 FL=1
MWRRQSAESWTPGHWRAKVAVMRLISFLVITGFSWRAGAAAEFSQPWGEPYSGVHATGPHVVAFWRFEPGAEDRDASGQTNTLKFDGAAAVKEGRFGGGLQTAAEGPRGQQRHAALAAHRPALSPPGAFTVDLWCKLMPAKEPDQAFLVDKKYASHNDYQFLLSAPDKSGQRVLQVSLGFGEDSAGFQSEPVRLENGRWHHLAFSYDGRGEVRFFCDGVNAGQARHPGRGAVMPGKNSLSIGDRLGSYYHGFPGVLDEVRICQGALDFRSLDLDTGNSRLVFVRQEKAPPVELRVRNRQTAALGPGQAAISLAGLQTATAPVPPLAPGATHKLLFSPNTALRPGSYELRVRVEIPGQPTARAEEKFDVTLVARPLPNRMPVVMWGVYAPEGVQKELGRLKELGFTHCLGVRPHYDFIWEAKDDVLPAPPEAHAEARRMLDAALANGLGILAGASPGSWLAAKSEFQRINRAGKRLEKPDVCGNVPGAREFCEQVGRALGRGYGDHPAFAGALIHTEVRDHTALCFHEHDLAAFKKATGLDYPLEATGKAGVPYKNLKDFPANRVVAESHPILQFYRWFWSVGDGWNELHTRVHRGLHETGHPGLWTFHDPAVRCPSLPGSGGGVDVLSQWTYSYPDPIRIGLPTDELFAMARASVPPQKVMKMTQIIWYRSQTAPIGKKSADGETAPWEDRDPEAAYITIAPTHLREAFWTKIARPIQGIMYHGWQSLVPGDSRASYRYTHPATQHELRQLIQTIVEPLGPTLLQVPDRPADVAFLESFASQVFAQRGEWGWSRGWAGEAYLVLQHAQLQPEVIYEDTLLKRGLAPYRVLFLLDCDVLTEPVVRQIEAFQQRGGVVIGDDRLCPAIKPNVRFPVHLRTNRADLAYTNLLTRARELRNALAGKYFWPTDSDNPDLVTRARRYREADYLFVVNDKREFGNYVGQHGLVMENGLPSTGTLSLNRTSGHVYDLVAGREVHAVNRADRLAWRTDLGPGEGGVFLVLKEAIAEVRVSAPARVKTGQTLTCQVEILDSRRQPVPAVTPAQVEILDADGRAAEFSGYYGLKDGKLALQLDIAPNDPTGCWQIRVRDLASGLSGRAYFQVEPDGP